MLEKLKDIEVYELGNELNALTCYNYQLGKDCNWKGIIETYINLKQIIFEELNKQVRPHLTEDEWIMLLIKLNYPLDNVTVASESFVPF